MQTDFWFAVAPLILVQTMYCIGTNLLDNGFRYIDRIRVTHAFKAVIITVNLFITLKGRDQKLSSAANLFIN